MKAFTQPEPLTDAELDRLGDFLKSCKGGKAMNLEELVTDSLEEYERRALEFASNRALLQRVREKIAQNRRTAPLFDTDLFRKQIESAYITMYERQRRGERPQGFTVEPD